MTNNSTLSSPHEVNVHVLEVTVVLVILIILSVLGNFLVCYAFLIQPRLRSVLYYPVLNLAVADILCGLVAMTSYLAKKHVFGGEKERIVCDVSRFSYFVTEYASVLSLTVISVERMLSIFRPLAHTTTVTSRRMKTAIVLLWCDAIAVSGLPFFWRSAHDTTSCSFEPTKAWSVMVISTNVFLPFFIILLSQTSIYFIAIKHSVFIKHQKHAAWRRNNERPRRHPSRFRRNPSGSRHSPSESEHNPSESRHNPNTPGHNPSRSDAWRLERKATITLSVVVGLFLVCWGPSSVYYFMKIVSPQTFDRSIWKKHEGLFNAIVKLLTFANSCFNPVIYAWLNKDFRNAFRRVLSRRLYASAVERQASSRTSESLRRQPTEESISMDIKTGN